jgi:predicted phage-related endonuclease
MASRPTLKKVDLRDLTEIMEGFAKDYSKMTIEEQIDLAAHLRAVVKTCDVIDKKVKTMIKEKRGGKAGTVMGNLFKAVLKIVPTARLDQKGLKEEEPETYEAFLKTSDDQHVTFELR